MSPEDTRMCIDCGTGHLDNHELEVCTHIYIYTPTALLCCRAFGHLSDAVRGADVLLHSRLHCAHLLRPCYWGAWVRGSCARALFERCDARSMRSREHDCMPDLSELCLRPQASAVFGMITCFFVSPCLCLCLSHYALDITGQQLRDRSQLHRQHDATRLRTETTAWLFQRPVLHSVDGRLCVPHERQLVQHAKSLGVHGCCKH